MTGWQLAMQMYQVAPTPLSDRQPEGLLVGKREDCVKPQEIREWARLRGLGFSIRQIADLSNRDRKTIRIGLKRGAA